MTVQKAGKTMKENLLQRYNPREAATISDWVMEVITGLTRIDRLMHNDQLLTEEQLRRWESIQQQLIEGMPVQYALGYGWFMGVQFKVNQAVLIPRPETEELVQWLIDIYNERNAFNGVILDIGTGSGCIPISIKSAIPNTKVYGLDISEAALTVAAENAIRLQKEVRWINADILQSESWENLPQANIIISNPPYIPIAEINQMEEHVIAFEPHLALFVENDYPLIFYKQILTFACTHLLPSGVVFFECHEDYAKEVALLGVNMGFSAMIKADMQGKERMVKFEWA
jgi:release factor glutamine methyltransferase